MRGELGSEFRTEFSMQNITLGIKIIKISMRAPLYLAPPYLNAERVLRLCSLDVEQADAVGVVGILLGGVLKTGRFAAGVDNHEALEEAPPEV